MHPYLIGGLVVLFLAVSVILILTVLIQRPAGGGLSGAFGSGAGSGQTAFGAKTGDVLTMVTIIVFAVWLLGAIGLNYATRPPANPTDPTIGPTGADIADPAEGGAEGAADDGADNQPADDQPAGDPTPPDGDEASEGDG